MLPRLRPYVTIALLAPPLLVPLAGCAGFGDYAWHTANPFHTPHRVKTPTENVARVAGKQVPSAGLTPEPGQPWPTSYPVDPTITDIERSGVGAVMVTGQTGSEVRVLYFAAARERIGVAEETVALPPGVTTLGGLRDWLAMAHPILAQPSIRGAVNQECAGPEAAVAPGDEIAFFPPPRAADMAVRVQTQPFDPGREAAVLTAGRGDVGGLASFVGLVRGEADLIDLTIEHYPGMTETSLARLADAAMGRFEVFEVTIIHRVGVLLPGDPIVLVLAVARHRQPALQAVQFLIDALKTDAPFWKKERSSDGARWVAPERC